MTALFSYIAAHCETIRALFRATAPKNSRKIRAASWQKTVGFPKKQAFAFLLGLAMLPGCAGRLSDTIQLQGKSGKVYARPDVPLVQTVTTDFGSVNLPVSATPVAFRSLSVCDASEIVFVQALGLSLSCTGEGAGLSFVSLGDSSPRMLADFVALLRSAGYGVQVLRGSVFVSGQSGTDNAEKISSPIPLADLDSVAEVASIAFVDSGFALRALPLDVPPEALDGLGLPVRAVALEDGRSLLLGDAASIQLVSDLWADGEFSVVRIAGSIPETFAEPLLDLGVTFASDPVGGSLLSGRRSDLRRAVAVVGDLVALPANVRADISFVSIDRSAAAALVPGSVFSLSSSLSKVVALPVIVSRSGGSSSFRSAISAPIPKSTIVDGVKTDSFEYLDAGVIVDFSPTVRADGSVFADISLEVSTFGAGEPPRISARSFESSIAVTSGQSVVLGVLDNSELGGSLRAVSGSGGGFGGGFSKSRGLLAAVATFRVIGPRGEDLFTVNLPGVSVVASKQ